MSDAVTKTAPGAVVRYDYGADMNRGFHNVDQSHFQIPFLAILQSNSPQVSNEERRIAGAVPGMLFNTVTNRVISGKEGLVLVPAHVEHCYTQWAPRNKGGGFRGRHEIGSDLVAEAIASGRKSEKGNKPLTKDGDELVETFYMYGLVLDDADAVDFSEMVVVAFTSTKIKKYKKAMTTIRTNKPTAGYPLFANRLRVKTVQESNSEGNFYNFDVEPVAGPGKVTESVIPPTLNDGPHPLLVAGRKLEEQVLGGAARAAYESQSGEGTGSTDNVF